MERYYSGKIEKSPRIPKLVEALYAKMPEIEPARAVLITESSPPDRGRTHLYPPRESVRAYFEEYTDYYP